MSLFFESIKLEAGKLQHLDLHAERMNKTRAMVFGSKNYIDLKEELIIPCDLTDSISKVKVVYGKYIESVAIENYAIKSHKKLKIIENPHIDYHLKSVDRAALTDFDSEVFDDAIFLQKGLLTDSSYCNLVFFDGKKWVTPKNYLLPGIKRKVLIKTQTIVEQEIRISEINAFSKIAFINAMRDFEKIYTFVVEDDIMTLELSA